MSPCPAAVPTLLQVEAAARAQKGGKAPGPDAIPNEVWKLFPVHTGQWLWPVCVHIALTCREPFHFKRAIVCALYKKGPAALPENYRSIALLNGIAKVWHGHLRKSIGSSILHRYDPLQLGGRAGIPVSFAVAAFRAASDLCTAQGRCEAVLFVDIQAAYYEASRVLLFQGDPDLSQPPGEHLSHLSSLVSVLVQEGALQMLGVPHEEIALLQDCVASHWTLSGSRNVYLASRGSRPGDGLADILFGALFAIALRHIRQVCQSEGWAHYSAGALIGKSDEVLPLGWADDLAILSDYASPADLQENFPRVAVVALSTLRFLRFRVNLGPGKTEAMLHIRGARAKEVRRQMLGLDPCLHLCTGDKLRLTPEYRYLGVVQTPKDTGRRDTELCARRAQTAWAHARSLIASPTLPWALKQAWFAGRVLPAAYATLATNIAIFESAARTLLQSWRYGHFVTRPTMLVLLGLCAPEHACVVARARLVLLLLDKAPPAVWDLVEAAWNRDTPWCQLLVDSCRQFLPAVRFPSGERVPHCTLQALRQVRQPLSKAIKFISRWGTVQAACCALWRDISTPRERRIIGAVQAIRCHICQEVFPSRHAVAAHIHRKHSVVSCYTKLTNGTVCLWCHTEMHSTDRLKYHLRTTPACLHGLRVSVGEVYAYGTGTKRTGQRQHRGLPALRLPGPINATPAQRKAAAEGRPCTPEELVEELRSRLGVSSANEWPTGPAREADVQAPGVLTPLSQGGERLNDGAVSPALTGEAVRPPHSSPAPLRWYRLVTASQADSADEQGHFCLSPLWAQLVGTPGIWCLPVEWHRLWPLWHAMQADAPWDASHKRAFGILRGALTDKPLAAWALAVSCQYHFCDCRFQEGM